MPSAVPCAFDDEWDDYEAKRSTARVALGEETFVAAWKEGAAMTIEQAVEHALEALEARDQANAT